MLTTLRRASAGQPPFGHGLRQEKWRGQVDLQHGVPVGLRMIRNRRAFDDAGVVDEDVHAPAILHDLRDDFGGALLGELAEILGVGIELCAERFRFHAGFRLVADVHADDVGAFAREGEGDGLADSAAGPGDDGYFVLKTPRDSLILIRHQFRLARELGIMLFCCFNFCIHKFSMERRSPTRRGRRKTFNSQQPTSNIQWGTGVLNAVIECWALNVECSMFPILISPGRRPALHTTANLAASPRPCRRTPGFRRPCPR